LFLPLLFFSYLSSFLSSSSFVSFRNSSALSGSTIYYSKRYSKLKLSL
jgi:hypothetical protein